MKSLLSTVDKMLLEPWSLINLLKCVIIDTWTAEEKHHCWSPLSENRGATFIFLPNVEVYASWENPQISVKTCKRVCFGLAKAPLQMQPHDYKFVDLKRVLLSPQSFWALVAQYFHRSVWQNLQNISQRFLLPIPLSLSTRIYSTREILMLSKSSLSIQLWVRGSSYFILERDRLMFFLNRAFCSCFPVLFARRVLLSQHVKIKSAIWILGLNTPHNTALFCITLLPVCIGGVHMFSFIDISMKLTTALSTQIPKMSSEAAMLNCASEVDVAPTAAPTPAPMGPTVAELEWVT